MASTNRKVFPKPAPDPHLFPGFAGGHDIAYRLYTVVPRLVTFINDLTNWYVRLNRARLKVCLCWFAEWA